MGRRGRAWTDVDGLSAHSARAGRTHKSTRTKFGAKRINGTFFIRLQSGLFCLEGLPITSLPRAYLRGFAAEHFKLPIEAVHFFVSCEGIPRIQIFLHCGVSIFRGFFTLSSIERELWRLLSGASDQKLTPKMSKCIICLNIFVLYCENFTRIKMINLLQNSEMKLPSHRHKDKY